VRESMSGNLCRCGAYTNIVAAIQDVRKEGTNAPV
jgi:xanthine dehydrogenase YagT iron-sulfur-binding subunit